MPARKIVDLRKLLAERFPQETLPAGSCLTTGVRQLDEVLTGGLTKGAITEVSSVPPQAGSATLVAALLEQACRERYFIALIDGRDSFDPESIGDDAILRHLLWVRCGKASEALQAADLLLRDGNFPLVILDLVLNPALELRRIPASNWYRLQRLVEPAPTAFLVLTPQSMIASAQWKLCLTNRWMLPQLDWAAGDLPACLTMQVQRGQQPNQWRSEPRHVLAS
ncbi:MAG: hypothetical protein H0X40_01275 [Chthoniobacterales bacterium]|nr:hypothetical protein [Chthoniobacterales bacterium]